MATEIERKFLVADASVVQGLSGVRMGQGYIADNGMWVRVRIAGDTGWLTLKGPSKGMSRAEFEYQIPLEDAQVLLAEHCAHGSLCKVRYIVPVDGFDFEVDVFEGPLAGLVTAEIELDTEDVQPPHPAWLGAEVTQDLRYSNSQLAKTRALPSPALLADAAG
ncbi:CYTH domain-containing protein [Xylophilus rhododendri]|uniref:CYTH domain-containing protein n=1 Tax=Xylophilus rhododendri TaxID=2697032 RepID=A0A857J422_9BURK|nr:CYTH domain-containing protein [Xylophilus rhododendri]QHI97618.1 CYTH domain-containing protein [Xylophilus rhododendri]